MATWPINKIGSCFRLALIFFLAPMAFSKGLTLVDHGACRFIISHAGDASQDIRDSVDQLAYYVQESTGCNPQIQPEVTEHSEKTILWIGSKWLKQEKLNSLTPHAFTVDFSRPGMIILAGGSDRGTVYAVTEFLERYLGIRWLMPTELGEHIPSNHNLVVKKSNVTQEPAFEIRMLSGIKHPAIRKWMGNLRMGGHISFGHNMNRIFPPDIYTRSHPDFFPIKNGVRHIPANNSIYRWQPCFSAQGLVEEAVQNICSYFDQNPDKTSFSLAINDSTTFCECELCLPRYGKKKNSYGFNDVSDLYYTWANKVAEGVLKSHPGKKFGCLAYIQCGDAPGGYPSIELDIHPSIVPFLTYDRAKWSSRKIRRAGRRLTRKYLSKSHQIGWYDYVYGTPYLLPRVYFHRMANNYRWAAQRGVAYQYAEAYPNFGEGPKIYLTLKLMWEPTLDVDELLEEWYELAVGRKAAIPLKAYFDHWEHFWSKRILKSPWFTEKGQWMWFGDPEYVLEITQKDLILSRQLLEETVLLAMEGKQKQRAGIFLKAFEYYEASAIAYLGQVAERDLHGITQEQTQTYNAKRYILVNQFEQDPLLKHAMRFDRKSRLDLDLLNWNPPQIYPVSE